MNSVKKVLLLAAVVCIHAAPTPEECEGLSKRLPTQDRHKILGEWVMTWGVTDNPKAFEEWGSIQSLHTDIRPLVDNNTIVLIERNLMPDNSCITYFANMSMVADAGEYYTLQVDAATEDKDGVSAPFNESVTADFYETCPDCMLIVYKSIPARYLLSYRREGQHQDVQQLRAADSDLSKLAECLGFPNDQPVKYDGAADFCHKKSAPDAEQS